MKNRQEKKGKLMINPGKCKTGYMDRVLSEYLLGIVSNLLKIKQLGFLLRCVCVCVCVLTASFLHPTVL